jgi:hypothetical protein
MYNIADDAWDVVVPAALIRKARVVLLIVGNGSS